MRRAPRNKGGVGWDAHHLAVAARLKLAAALEGCVRGDGAWMAEGYGVHSCGVLALRAGDDMMICVMLTCGEKMRSVMLIDVRQSPHTYVTLLQSGILRYPSSRN